MSELVPLPAQPAGVSWPTAAWPRAQTPEPLARAIEPLFDPEADLGVGLATLVVVGGRLVAERYGPDTDADTTLISWSMAKTITALLVGLAVAEGRLALDEPAPVPEWVGDERGTITLDNLMSMRSGLAFAEDYVDAEASDCIEMLFGSGADDVAAYAVSRPLAHPPGTHWNYSSGETNIIARILGQAIGEPIGAWARRVLFDPLGASSVSLRTDRAGTFVGSSFAYATARDYARLGLLALRGGQWEGRPLLPEGWVDRLRTPQAHDPETGQGYGRQTWTSPDGRGTFSMNGYEGQYVICVPALDTVLVRLGKTPIERRDPLRRQLDAVLLAVEQSASSIEEMST